MRVVVDLAGVCPLLRLRLPNDGEPLDDELVQIALRFGLPAFFELRRVDLCRLLSIRSEISRSSGELKSLPLEAEADLVDLPLLSEAPASSLGSTLFALIHASKSSCR